MRKAGYTTLIISLGIFLPSFVAFVFLFSSYIYSGVQAEAAEEFLRSEPSHSYTNDTLAQLLEEGVSYEESADEDIKAKYISPEEIEFISYSEKWDEATLELLYKELLRNGHGEELYSLHDVVVYAEADDVAAATHKNTIRYCSVPFAHTLLPKDFKFGFSRSGSRITLYDGDRIITPEAMADSLSHEYGHHYTRYHMFGKLDETLFDTEYARLRGLTPENSYAQSEGDEEYYYDNHYKYILEIAAEDYVALMGSPASRETADYKDIMESLYMDEYTREKLTRSCCVQENLTIPMACELEGVAEYFYGFLEEEPPEYDVKKEMNIRITPYKRSYDLVGGYKTFIYYGVEFDKVYGEDATYVLTCYDPGDYYHTRYPIRTVTKGENTRCYIGNAVRDAGGSVIYSDDGIAKGTKIFIVNVITADGNMYTSTPFSYKF
ncbi:MAG: hypothetical protein IJA55_02445 [Clostridia bacterium]|nr:hypothetical protein [Clostridia bacterium]